MLTQNTYVGIYILYTFISYINMVLYACSWNLVRRDGWLMVLSRRRRARLKKVAHVNNNYYKCLSRTLVVHSHRQRVSFTRSRCSVIRSITIITTPTIYATATIEKYITIFITNKQYVYWFGKNFTVRISYWQKKKINSENSISKNPT